MKRILYYPQISSIENGKVILNTEATFNIMLNFIKEMNCIQKKKKYEWHMIIPKNSILNREIPDNIILHKIYMFPDSKIGRYDFNANGVKAIIDEVKPDLIFNNNPTLSRNIRILVGDSIPIIQRNDFQGHGLPDNIRYRIRQVDGVMSADVAFETSESNKQFFISFARKEFNKKIIDMLQEKIRTIESGVYKKEVDSYKKRRPLFPQHFKNMKHIVFPGRISTTNYNHWRDYVDTILQEKMNRGYMFIFTNPTKKKGVKILWDYIYNRGFIITQTEYIYFTEWLCVKKGKSIRIYLFKKPDSREHYIDLLKQSEIGVQLFEKKEEAYGGIAAREMAHCKMDILLSDTFLINGFVGKHYKEYVIFKYSTKEIKSKLDKLVENESENIFGFSYHYDTTEVGALTLLNTMGRLMK